MLKQTADACTSLYSFSHLLLSPSMRGRADHFPWRKHAPPINELHRRTAPATCICKKILLGKTIKHGYKFSVETQSEH
uniref:Uncharacterized protein n=1 Tax=Aegilops tauschii subsp. strangulata TaxID=200361 RepID=A0A453QNZ3_AEGTS